MVTNRLLSILNLLSVLASIVNSVTSSPFLAPNPIYSSAGIFDLYNSAAFTSGGSISPLTFSLTFTRTHSTTTYSFGYSIQKIDYTISGNKVQYSLEKGTKSATSISMNFYTNNANKFASLSIAYIIIQPLFNLVDFQVSWINPNSNIIDGQNFQVTVNGVGPYSSGTQTIWVILVGVDADLPGNKQHDLYSTASLTSTTSILFQISTISPVAFTLNSVIIEAFIYDQPLLSSYQRSARFTFGQTTGLASYSNSIMQSYNTIYGVRTYHTVNQAFLKYTWTLSSPLLSISSTNAFSYVLFQYLFLQFIFCAASTPYLDVATSTCYDLAPSHKYADQYNQLQSCPYDCDACTAAGVCTQCSSTVDFRILSGSRCISLDGYYDSGVSVAVTCNSPCKTCSSATVCTSCYLGDQLSGTTCILNPPCGNAALSATQACDDGNTVSGDGCDSICQIQPYFTCTSIPSVCNFVSFSASFASLTKSATSNEFTVTYQLQPATATAYSTLNWATLITQQSTLPITMSSTNYDSSQGTLSATYSYTQSLNDATLILNFAFPNKAPFQNVPSATAQAAFAQEDNNLSLDVYSDSDYATVRLIYIISAVLSAFALFLFVFGLFGRKIISLQLITVFQVACLSITTLDRLSPALHGLNGLCYSFGYAFSFKSSTVHSKYSPLNLKLLFFNNINLNLILILFPLVCALILILYIKAKSSQANKKLVQLQIRMRGQWLFYVMMFSLYLFILSLGFAFMRPSLVKASQILGLLLISIFLIVTCYLIKCILFQDLSMGEFTFCFNHQRWISRNYYFILSIERCLTSLAFLLVPMSNKFIILVISIILVQIFMAVTLKPYKIYGGSLRPFLNLLILLFIEIIFTLIPFTPSSQNYFPFVILALLALTFTYNIYYIFKYFCCSKQESAHESVKQEQSNLINNQRLKMELNSSFLTNNHHAVLRKSSQNIPSTPFDYRGGLEDIKSKLNVIRQIKTQLYAENIPRQQMPINDAL